MLYPLKFAPILKDKIWGGEKLKALFEKETNSPDLGESWELSGVKNDESVVTNGILAGKDLPTLINTYKGDFLGEKVYAKYGNTFPLLFKLIDANDYLSIQVHPGDSMAKKRHDSFGKTEMWYVVDADPGAELIIGFSKTVTREEYVAAVEQGRVEDIMQSVPAEKGDVFFIPAGLVHAIGKGVVVAEIQQTSDITYRIYDYKRTDDKGQERELHTEEALDVINFEETKEPKTKYDSRLNELTHLVKSDYFITNLLRFDKERVCSYPSSDSFVAYMCLEGAFDIEYNGEKTKVKKGDTILLPATLNELKLLPGEESLLLEVSVPV